jgi:hypothetical protein
MGLNFKSWTGLLVLIATGTLIPAVVMAQPAEPNADTIGDLTPADAINRAFYKNDPNFFRNRDLDRQFDLIFGPGLINRTTFPENEIARDSQLVDLIYRDALEQQVSSDPIIRTPDLPNPYNSSLLTNPRYTGSNASRVPGTEYVYETRPPQ